MFVATELLRTDLPILFYNTLNYHLSGITTFMSWYGYNFADSNNQCVRWNGQSAKISLRSVNNIQ